MAPWRREDFDPLPEDAGKIWRYLSLGKFLAMLDTRTLFFCRLDRLEDQYEGTYPKLEQAVTPREMAVSLRLQRRLCAAVNCWHMNEHESVAMWALYVGSTEGVAVESRVGRLVRALEGSNFLSGIAAVGVGRVRYVDFETLAESWGVVGPKPFLTKRSSFGHEQELRAVIYEYRQPLDEHAAPHPAFQSLIEQGGLSVDVDLSTLIEGVRVAPQTPSWFFDLVKREVARHALDVPVQRSSLEIPPHLG